MPYKCRYCGKCFSQSCGHIGLMKWQWRNKSLNDAISRECANGVGNKTIVQKFHLSASTVERRLHRNHEKLLKEQLNYPCPVVQGIDEHSIHRSGARGHKFAVTLADLRNHRIYEVFDGKSLATLEPNLCRIRGRERGKVVCMDLCPPFRSIVQRLFPKAKIVADRFHVIRQVTETFLEFSSAADHDIHRKRGRHPRPSHERGETGQRPKAAFGKTLCDESGDRDGIPLQGRVLFALKPQSANESEMPPP